VRNVGRGRDGQDSRGGGEGRSNIVLVWKKGGWLGPLGKKPSREGGWGEKKMVKEWHRDSKNKTTDVGLFRKKGVEKNGEQRGRD